MSRKEGIGQMLLAGSHPNGKRSGDERVPPTDRQNGKGQPAETGDATVTLTSTASASAQKLRRRPGPAKGTKRRPLARRYEPLAAPIMLDTHEAADALRCSVPALRARCRRAARIAPDGSVTAPLAPGVTAIKFGRSTWRVRFDHGQQASA